MPDMRHKMHIFELHFRPLAWVSLDASFRYTCTADDTPYSLGKWSGRSRIVTDCNQSATVMESDMTQYIGSLGSDDGGKVARFSSTMGRNCIGHNASTMLHGPC